MSTKFSSHAIKWYKLVTATAMFAYTLLLVAMAFSLGRMPESGPEYLLVGSAFSAAACTLAAVGWASLAKETKDLCLGLALSIGSVGVGTMQFGIYLLNH